MTEERKEGWANNVLYICIRYDLQLSFMMLMIREPTHIDYYPHTETFNYIVDQWFEVSLDVQNVAPIPLVQWLMNNSSIEGLTIRDVNGKKIAIIVGSN